MGLTDLECSEFVWFLELVMPLLLLSSCCCHENHYKLFKNIFLKQAVNRFLRRVLIAVISCFYHFMSPCFTSRLCLKLTLFLILKRELNLLRVIETCHFVLLGNNFFTVFLTDLITCSPFFWYSIIRKCFLSSYFSTIV